MSIPNDRAAYRILSVHGFFGPDDHLYIEGECIVFDGEPNEEMEPLNTLAKERLTAHIEKLDVLAREKAEKTGTSYTSRPRTLDGSIALATEQERNKMSIMGRKDEVTTIERLELEPIPEVGGLKRGRGRPTKASLAI